MHKTCGYRKKWQILKSLVKEFGLYLKEYQEIDSFCRGLTLSGLHSKWGGRGIPTRKQWRQNWVQEAFYSNPRYSLFPSSTPGCRGQRWTVQTCLTCQRSQRFLNNPGHVLWGDRPEAQLGSQAGERWGTKTWALPGVGVLGDIELQRTHR